MTAGYETDLVRILESVRRAADLYSLDASRLKPCVSMILDGNLGAASRHASAFVLGLELRGMDMSQTDAERLVSMWARRIGYEPWKAVRSVRDAWRPNPDGTFRYRTPGLKKGPRTRAFEVLAPICEVVGCPSNCSPFAALVQKQGDGSLRLYQRLGWPETLRRARRTASDDVYRALIRLETEREIPAGAPLRVSYDQIALRARRDRSKIGVHLAYLQTVGLLARFEHGSGSGPNARDRLGSLVARTVPIPSPHVPALGTTGGRRPPL